VANEIYLFNAKIIAHRDLLQQKNNELTDLNEEIESTLRETVYTMGVIEERRSKETNNHTKRVSLYCQLLARLAGLSEGGVDIIAAASPLHDIGKLGIPDEILLKPSKLNDEEFKIMQNHPVIGYSMLKHSNRDVLMAAGIIALQHHEKWDGSGYPQGLEGEAIHLYGRIVALADVFDALISKRTYKEPWDMVRIVAWMTEQRGKHFDPAMVDVFLEHADDFRAIHERYPSDGI
jgi:response regulator RpfG family c-di-GMP phosphodiesterase